MDTLQPKSCYFICGTPRSGSTLFAEALEATGLAGRPREFFDKGFEPFWFENLGITSPGEYFDKILEAGTTPNGVFGAKLLWYQTEHLALRLGKPLADIGEDVLAKTFPNLRYIWITRRDKARQAVSYYKAIQTDVWWRIRGDENGPAGKGEDQVPFDFAEIDRLARLVTEYDANWKHFFERRAIEPHVITYEGLNAELGATVLNALRWLGVTTPPGFAHAEPRLIKQANALSEAWVKRYSDLSQAGLPGARDGSSLGGGCRLPSAGTGLELAAGPGATGFTTGTPGPGPARLNTDAAARLPHH
jgi:LPS sulfotransferase NodH